MGGRKSRQWFVIPAPTPSRSLLSQASEDQLKGRGLFRWPFIFTSGVSFQTTLLLRCDCSAVRGLFRWSFIFTSGVSFQTTLLLRCDCSAVRGLFRWSFIFTSGVSFQTTYYYDVTVQLCGGWALTSPEMERVIWGRGGWGGW